MRPTLRWVTAALAAAGILCLLLAVLRPVLPGDLRSPTPPVGLLGALCSFGLLLVLVHGHATGCPSCGRWWSRTKGATEFMAREVFERDGDAFARSRYRTSYTCRHCERTWSVTETDEYRVHQPHR